MGRHPCMEEFNSNHGGAGDWMVLATRPAIILTGYWQPSLKIKHYGKRNCQPRQWSSPVLASTWIRNTGKLNNHYERSCKRGCNDFDCRSLLATKFQSYHQHTPLTSKKMHWHNFSFPRNFISKISDTAMIIAKCNQHWDGKEKWECSQQNTAPLERRNFKALTWQ